jgi:hypothetical protein
VVEDGSQEMPMYLKDEGVIFRSGNDLHQFRTINVKTYEVWSRFLIWIASEIIPTRC